MPWLTTEAAAALSETTVRLATLVELRFSTGTMNLWTGVGRRTLNGVIHEGLGTLGSIDGLSQSRAPNSDKVTLSLSCVEPRIAAIAVAENSVVRGRMAIIRLQLFTGEWQALGAPIPVFWGLMQRISVSRKGATDEGGGTRTATIEVENAFAGRSRPTNGLYTDAHQRADFPDDNGCRFVARQASQVIEWPSY